MKKILTIIAAAAALVLAVCSCSSLRMSPEQKALMERAVIDSLGNRTYTIEVSMVHPTHGTSRHVNNYYLSVKGDKLVTVLPYYGVAYSLPYGGDTGYHLNSEITEYNESAPKPDRRQIRIITKVFEGGRNETVSFNLTVFVNGRAQINAYSQNREPISYSGALVL